MAIDRAVVYGDSSAPVKLVIDAAFLEPVETIATSRMAEVEVERATRIANASVEVARDTRALLESCVLIDVTRDILRSAAGLASLRVRSLDAIHLATALRLGADTFVAYDDRLCAAARARGLLVAAPGTAPSF